MAARSMGIFDESMRVVAPVASATTPVHGAHHRAVSRHIGGAGPRPAYEQLRKVADAQRAAANAAHLVDEARPTARRTRRRPGPRPDSRPAAGRTSNSGRAGSSTTAGRSRRPKPHLHRRGGSRAGSTRSAPSPRCRAPADRRSRSALPRRRDGTGADHRHLDAHRRRRALCGWRAAATGWPRLGSSCLVLLALVVAAGRRRALDLVSLWPVDALDDHPARRAGPRASLPHHGRLVRGRRRLRAVRRSDCWPRAWRGSWVSSVSPPPPRSAPPRSLALFTATSDLRPFGLHLPINPRQVNELWLGKFRSWVYGVGFGWQIGVGFATYIMTAAVYLTVALAALTGRPAGGVRRLRGLRTAAGAGDPARRDASPPRSDWWRSTVGSTRWPNRYDVPSSGCSSRWPPSRRVSRGRRPWRSWRRWRSWAERQSLRSRHASAYPYRADVATTRRAGADVDADAIHAIEVHAQIGREDTLAT